MSVRRFSMWEQIFVYGWLRRRRELKTGQDENQQQGKGQEDRKMALLHVDFFSTVLGLSMNMDVILPQQTWGQIGMEGKGAEGKYKTMYLLHGMSDDQTVWQRRTSIERYVTKLGIAVVMPTTHLAFYTDTAYGMKYWTFVSQELPKICREFFPQMSTEREDTLAAGLSMGGYGAWKLGLGACDTFGAAASLSGALDIVEDYRRNERENPEVMTLFRGIFTSEEQLKGSDNDLLALAQRLAAGKKALPRLYAWCGTEDFLYQGNLKAWEHVKKLGFDLTCEESAGDHQWKYWDAKIQDVLRWWLGTDIDLQ